MKPIKTFEDFRKYGLRIKKRGKTYTFERFNPVGIVLAGAEYGYHVVKKSLKK